VARDVEDVAVALGGDHADRGSAVLDHDVRRDGRPVEHLLERSRALPGFTGDLGYELWTTPNRALALWDLLFDAGSLHGLRAVGTAALNLARIEAGELTLERQHVDLAELADETIEAMEPMARHQQVHLCLEATGCVPVLGGPEALGRVMRNLVDNAIRHAPAASHVIVRVLNGDGATVAVIDDGPGFDPALLPAAFDSFSRADPSRNRDTGGAGLGLAIAKGVIEAHGGEIWADPGPGGRVSFRLPAPA